MLLYYNFLKFLSTGWIIRLYYDLDQDDPILPKLCGLSCQTNFDLCDVQRLPGTPISMGKTKYMSRELNTELKGKNIFPMNWRFFPTIDPQVDAYLSRDLDSEFNAREIAGKFSFFFKKKSWQSYGFCSFLNFFPHNYS